MTGRLAISAYPSPSVMTFNWRKIIGHLSATAWVVCWLVGEGISGETNLFQKIIGVLLLVGLPMAAALLATRLWLLLYAIPLVLFLIEWL